MLPRSVLVALTTAIVASGVAVLATTQVAAAAPPSSTAGKTYVALGDSYAAGYGLPAPSTPTGKPVPGCEQTTGDYPRILAGKLGLTLTDVTCSNATTVDFAHPQSVTGGQAPPQLDIFKTVHPDLVTVTIGGNDLGFVSIATACAATAGNGPTARVYGSGGTGGFSFSSCRDYFNSTAANGGKAANPYDHLAAVVAKVSAAIAAVQRAAPKAKIAVIAYPAIAPDAAHTPAGGCYTSLARTPTSGNPLPSALPFTDVDIPYLQVLQQQLDAGIGRAAARLHASYADIYASSLAHSACQPENVRWVEPVTPDGGGTNVLHPNLAGTTAMADALAPVVQKLLVAPSSSPVTSASSPSATPASTSASTSVSTAPLAATGPVTPFGWTLLWAGVLAAAGALLLLVGLRGRRRPGTHR